MLRLAAVFGLIVALVRFRIRQTIIPFLLLALAIIVIAIDDASFLEVRPRYAPNLVSDVR